MQLTHNGVASSDAWFASRIDAFHRCMVGSPPVSRLRRINSYAFLGSGALSDPDEGASCMTSVGSSERSRKESRRSLPFMAEKSLCGRTWKVPPVASTMKTMGQIIHIRTRGRRTTVAQDVHEVVIGL